MLKVKAKRGKYHGLWSTEQSHADSFIVFLYKSRALKSLAIIWLRFST